ncbi:MAG: response regulator [Armatimonadetes bacterium]|nr:response regulator [Armatimonadota bacterium]MDE2206323.1 response regulator [Armatimonadota bacterium]
MSRPLNVLLLEDNATDAEFILRALTDSGFEVVSNRVENEADFVAALSPDLDVILADYSLPQYNGLEALKVLREMAFDTPFIFIAGAIGESLAVEAIRLGAADYLLKNSLTRLGQAVSQATQNRQLRQARRHAEDALRRAKAELELRVQRRTAELNAANEKLTEEIRERNWLDSVLKQSEHRHRMLARAANDALWDRDLTTQELVWSEGYTALFGYDTTESAVTLSQHIDRIHPEDRDRIIKSLNDFVQARGTYWTEEYRYHCADERVAHVLDRGYLVTEDGGEPVRMVGAITDMTHRRRADEAMAELERRATLEEAVGTAITSSHALRPMLQNCAQAVAEHFGAARVRIFTCDVAASMLNLEISEGSAPDPPGEQHVPIGRFAVGRVAQDRKPIMASTVSADQDSCDAEWAQREGISAYAGYPLIVERELVGVLEVFSRTPMTVMRFEALAAAADGIALAIDRSHNVRQLSEQSEALAKALKDAENASRMKSDFVATMSHEIRTPLNGIVGAATLLNGTPLSEEQRGFMQMLQTSAESLLEIVNDILDFSKIEAGKLQLESAPFSFAEMVANSTAMMATRAEEKRLDLVLRVSPAMPTALRGDSARMRQILLNLISNAIKFTEVGHVFVNVDVEDDQGDRITVVTRVEDTGIGIAPEKLDHIFDMFTQADSSTTRQFGGTGLGLAICRQLVQLMGGEITVSSTVGQGTAFAFTLTLPVAERSFEPAPIPLELANARVLLVGENALHRRVVREIITGRGLRTSECEAISDCADSAIRAAHDGDPFTVVVADTSRRTETLGEILEAVQSAGVSMAVVALSSRSAQHNERYSGHANVVAVPMPIVPEALFDAMARAFQAAHPTSGSAELSSAELTELAGGLPPVVVAPPVQAPVVAAPATIAASILVAEDNMVNQQVARRMLEKLGCTVDLVSNGKDAVTALGEKHYDAIFMDCQMPVMDGYEATAEIRRIQADTGLHVPIIAITANSMKGDKENCIAAGMDSYISKPIREQELRDALNLHAPHLFETAAAPTEIESVPEPEPAGMPAAPLPEAMSVEPEFVRSLMPLVESECPALCNGLRRSARTGDAEGVRRIAHQIKGTALMLNAYRFADVAAKLEDMGRRGNLSGVDGLLNELDHEYDVLHDALEKYAATA